MRERWGMGIGWAALLCLVFVTVGCATAQIAERRVVSGRITDQQGRPMPGTPVLVVGRQLELTAKLDYVELSRRALKVLTADDGWYRVEFVPDEFGNNLYLFFYAEEGFDGIRFQKPEGIDITRRLKEERVLRLDQVLHDHPHWKEVQRKIAQFGADSAKGKALRQLGLPERIDRVAGDQATKTWWYYASGVSYRFVGPALEGSYTFQPIQGVLPPPAMK